MNIKEQIYTKVKCIRLDPVLKHQIEQFCRNADVTFSEFSRDLWVNKLRESK